MTILHHKVIIIIIIIIIKIASYIYMHAQNHNSNYVEWVAT